MTISYVEYPEIQTAEFTVTGKVTRADYDAVITPLQAFIDRHGTVKIIEVLQDYGGFEPSLFMPGIRFDLKNLSRISHVAVVSDIGWISPLVKLAGSVLTTRLRLFALSELEAAREWIAAPNAVGQ